MAEHEHGKMKIDVQEKTFENFLKFSGYVAAVSILLLIFIAIVNG
ncbi:MAG: aa3-type cytochrome c oxidase subunit IV [Pseudomonadota bacterium]